LRQKGLPFFPTQKTPEVLTGRQQDSILTNSLIKLNAIKGIFLDPFFCAKNSFSRSFLSSVRDLIMCVDKLVGPPQ
jgi:hypothetical protein